MRIALATCAKLPDWEVDDRPLHEALARRGVEAARPAWDDSSVDWGAFDACLIRTTWDYCEQRDAFVEWADRAGTLTRLFNPPAVVRWNTDKHYLRDLETRDVPLIPTAWLERGQPVDLEALLADRGWQRGFIKPAVGSTARETLRFDADADGLAAASGHLARLLRRESVLLQPYLASVECEGELSVIFIDGEITHAVRKTPVAGDYRVQDDFGASDAPARLTPQEQAMANRIASLASGLAASLQAREAAASSSCGGAAGGPPLSTTGTGTTGASLLYARVDLLRDDEDRLRLSELELVEPSLFFRHCPGAAERLAEALCRRCRAAI
jgi:hypothetical protein